MSQIPPPYGPMNPQQPGFPPQPMAGGYAAPPPKQTNVMAIVSLVAGALFCIPGITGLVAVITGLIGFSRGRDPRMGGRGLAIAGIILGVLSLAGWGVVGYGAYWTYQQVAGAMNTVELTLRDVSEGRIEQAEQRTGGALSRARLTALQAELRGLGQLRSIALEEGNLDPASDPNAWQIRGTATFEQGTVRYSARVVEREGQVRVEEITIQRR